MDVESEIERFVQAASAHGAAVEVADSDAASGAADALLEVCERLSRAGKKRLLLSLLQNENASVRLWAAGYTLSLDETRAEKVLEELSGGTGLLSFSASMTLSQWRSGDLITP